MKTHRGRELIRLKSRMIDRAGAFIAVSDYIRQKMLNNGYPDDKIVVHRNGINLETFSSIEQRQREPVVLFIGRFVEKKGIPFLLRAAAALQSRGTGFRLVLIGGGPMEEELKAQAEATGIPCEFIGFVDGAKVREWLARASTLAVPSVVASNGDSEGLPTVLLEAQAMKTPVVATRHSGIPEGMVEGVTGELVDEKDWEALADRLQSFLESPGKVAQFGDAGRKFVTENFRIEDQVRGLEDIYSDVIARRS